MSYFCMYMVVILFAKVLLKVYVLNKTYQIMHAFG